MDKQRYESLIQEAEQALQDSSILQSGNKIFKSYNGQVAALGVSIVMSGLLPTLAIYYQDYKANDNKNAYRRNVLDVIAKMLGNFDNGTALLQRALANDVNSMEFTNLKTDIINASVALKQVIRTYNLID